MMGAMTTTPAALPDITDVTVLSVHDGDTASFRLRTAAFPVWLGFSMYGEIGPPLRARMAAYAARELKMPGGPEARYYLASLLGNYPGKLGATIASWDNYGGRYDLLVWTPDGWIHDLMCAAGFGLPWDGRGKQPVPVWPIPNPLAGS